RGLAFRATASEGRYSDRNNRRYALASLTWQPALPGKPGLRLETDWLDYAESSPDYSSPAHYGRVRPGVTWEPRLSDSLRLTLLGEVSLVCESRKWGSGVHAGLRWNRGQALDCGVEWMRYEIPGAQSTWSGSGIKVDLRARF
ncbi:MAG: hypothetical protein RLZZ399_2685, partial [Verrucomicrobiota bacterium]